MVQLLGEFMRESTLACGLLTRTAPTCVCLCIIFNSFSVYRKCIAALMYLVDFLQHIVENVSDAVLSD